MAIQSHRDLVVWQKAMLLAKEAYGLARLLPKVEEFRLTSQLLRAATSVPANIAEGHARGSRKDYARHVSIARGSLAETDTLLLLIVSVGLLNEGDTLRARQFCEEISKMLTALLTRLQEDPGA